MISPFTCVTMLMFAGSGLYLYQAKHGAEVETREIRRLVLEADAIRQRTGVLATEYQLENDTELLGKLAARFLPQLRPTQPAQFTTLADLAQRMPPIGLPPPPAEPAEPMLVYAFPPAPAVAGPGAAPVDTAARPRPPVPARSAPAASAQLASASRPAAPPAFGQAEAATLRAQQQPRISPVVSAGPVYGYGGSPYASPYGAPAPMVGSALGMARTMAPHPFAPTLQPPMSVDGGGRG